MPAQEFVCQNVCDVNIPSAALCGDRLDHFPSPTSMEFCTNAFRAALSEASTPRPDELPHQQAARHLTMAGLCIRFGLSHQVSEETTEELFDDAHRLAKSVKVETRQPHQHVVQATLIARSRDAYSGLKDGYSLDREARDALRLENSELSRQIAGAEIHPKQSNAHFLEDHPNPCYASEKARRTALTKTILHSLCLRAGMILYPNSFYDDTFDGWVVAKSMGVPLKGYRGDREPSSEPTPGVLEIFFNDCVELANKTRSGVYFNAKTTNLTNLVEEWLTLEGMGRNYGRADQSKEAAVLLALTKVFRNKVQTHREGLGYIPRA